MRYLITGGAGFIGSNTTRHLLDAGEDVSILDNLARPGSETNLEWLRQQYPNLEFHKVDVRDFGGLRDVLDKSGPFDAILHFAGQVAVTSSVEDPRDDFESNALGTLNILESIRISGTDPIFLFTSTNKVYGALNDIEVRERESRYEYVNLPDGVPESTPLDFYSPYGCSKGSADQYVRDYHRIYGVRTIVFRNSCIYGTRQFGVEDQGWLAWFVIAAVTGRPITIYGDGKQVRDVLFVKDLIEAMLLAVGEVETTAGEIYNIGGGVENAMSIWREFAPILSRVLGGGIEAQYEDWRPGDQKIYISDIAKANQDFGWKPRTGIDEGITKLVNWVSKNRRLFDN